ncbi:MAG: glycosyltransferase family 4 protein [Gemmataceae bacterium]|nr:glycosyltransferase family 4 protein [Gemmataceae bacterium]
MGAQSILSVAMNVVVSPGLSGGIEQSTVGLIHALGKLEGPEQYTLAVHSPELRDWLAPYCGPNQRMVMKPRRGRSNARGFSVTRMFKFALAPLLPVARYLQHLMSIPRSWPEVPVSDGFFESLGCDVLHFPTQAFTLCALPTIYNPHDLQHLHYPQFFTAHDLTCRETIYPAGCRYAHTVAVGTQWVKDDIIRRYGTDPDKIQVIPWAPPTQFYKDPTPEQTAAVPRKYQLEGPFALYPAVSWPHKNHLRLLEALAHLRDSRGLIVRLVCTGSPYKPFWPRIEARVRELNLQSQVKFLGFVPEEDLRALYRLAQFLVMPTLYEADSCPIHEAWSEGLPVASSNATALPDQVHDAGLLFDPKDVGSIADAVARMATDERLRADLRQRGYRRVKDFDWERTARAYRAVYRRAADVPLTEEDRWLLQWDWMREPQRSEAAPCPV